MSEIKEDTGKLFDKHINILKLVDAIAGHQFFAGWPELQSSSRQTRNIERGQKHALYELGMVFVNQSLKIIDGDKKMIDLVAIVSNMSDNLNCVMNNHYSTTGEHRSEMRKKVEHGIGKATDYCCREIKKLICHRFTSDEKLICGDDEKSCAACKELKKLISSIKTKIGAQAVVMPGVFQRVGTRSIASELIGALRDTARGFASLGYDAQNRRLAASAGNGAIRIQSRL